LEGGVVAGDVVDGEGEALCADEDDVDEPPAGGAAWAAVAAATLSAVARMIDCNLSISLTSLTCDIWLVSRK
jgi:hypothetical protein